MSSRGLLAGDVKIVSRGGNGRDRARLQAALLDAVRDGTLEGTTTFTVQVLDRGGSLLRSELIRRRPLITVDDIGYRFAAVAYNMRQLTLTFEPDDVTILRNYDEPLKANRATTTRAQFVGMMMREPKHAHIRFRCPVMNERPPIAKASDGD